MSKNSPRTEGKSLKIAADAEKVSWLKRRRYAILHMRSRFHHLISVVGIDFVLFSLIMRLPTWMIALATLVMMTARTGEVTLGTYGAGLVALASAMSQRTYRKLIELFSQRAVMFLSTTLNIPALAFLLVQMLDFQPNTVSGSIFTYLVAAWLVGITIAPLGAIMRTYWSQHYVETRDRRLLNSATSFESFLDLIALPLAAALVGIISILGTENSTLYTVIIIDVLGLFFILWRPEALQLHSSLVSRLDRVVESNNHGIHKLGWIPMLALSFWGIGMGSAQTMLALRSISQDTALNIGFYLAAMGLAATGTAITVSVLRARISTWQGWMLIGALLTLASLLLSIPSTSPRLIIVLLVFGAALGAGLMSVESIVTLVAAKANIILAQSTAQATLIAGTALGYVWGGVFGSSFGYQSALLVPVIASAGFFICSHIFGYRWRLLYEERLQPLPEDLTLK